MNVEERIIWLVRDHPALYDMDNKHYCSSAVKAMAWNEIAKECNLKSGLQARTLWTKLRDAFRSSLKRVDPNRNGDVASSGKLWKYYEQMSFLKAYMKERKRHSNDNNNETEPNVHEHEDTPCKRPSDDMLDESEDIVDVVRPKRQRTSKERYSSVQVQVGDERRGPPDDLKLFFESMYATTKRLTPSLQRVVKRKLFAAVTDAEEAMDQPPVPGVPSYVSDCSRQEDSRSSTSSPPIVTYDIEPYY